MVDTANKKTFHYIQSKLLNDALEDGIPFTENSRRKYPAYFNQGHVGLARYLLERLVRFAFLIQRLPTYEDNIIVSNLTQRDIAPYDWLETIRENYTDNELLKAIEELQELHDFTSEQLFNSFSSHKDTVTLYRGLTEPEIAQIIDKLTNHNEQEEITMQTNTLCSFTTSPRAYYHRLKLEVEIPIKDICFHYKYADVRTNAMRIEEEVLVMNRNIRRQFSFSKHNLTNLNENHVQLILDNVKAYKDLYIENPQDAIFEGETRFIVNSITREEIENDYLNNYPTWLQFLLKIFKR